MHADQRRLFGLQFALDQRHMQFAVQQIAVGDKAKIAVLGGHVALGYPLHGWLVM